MKADHEALQRAHEALAAEGAVRSQLVERLGNTARETQIAKETEGAALSADLAKAESMNRELSDARARLSSELHSERAEHEACRLQLISSQAALTRLRNDSTEMIATERARLTLALDELRRADRLAGVIHRSLNDAIRGTAEAAGLYLPDVPPPTSHGASMPSLGMGTAPPPGQHGTPLTRGVRATSPRQSYATSGVGPRSAALPHSAPPPPTVPSRLKVDDVQPKRPYLSRVAYAHATRPAALARCVASWH